MARSGVCVFVFCITLFAAATASQRVPADSSPDVQDEETPDDIAAPAATQLDVSKMSAPTRLLYQATRETKPKAIADCLAAAKKLIDGGADLKAVDSQGRTALHWTVFGSSYNTKPNIIVAYEEIADALITRGVEVNREDAYHDTALDYLLYSPNFEMQTLLLEHGANSGFLAATLPVFNRTAEEAAPTQKRIKPTWANADLTPGQTVDVRLLTPVYSDRSRTGDPIEGVITYPLCKNGEFVACKPDELLLAPGTKVNGAVLFAQKAPDKYSRPRLVLDFSNVVFKSGRQSSLYARVLSVDNARETVRNNEILGIIQPHASTKVALSFAAIGSINPIAGYTLRAVSAAYGLSIRRETAFPAGADLQLQIVRPSTLHEKQSWSGWKDLTMDSELREIITAAPSRTHTASGVPSDITNLLFVGTREQLLSAFGEAGWFQADELSLRSATKTLQATIRQSGYSAAPVSGLRIDNRLPDLVFQKSLNTFAKRHHLRIWKQPFAYHSREIWIGAATHDVAISNARAGTKWSHRIDPHIDRERDWVATDLLFAGTAVAYTEVDRPTIPQKAANATGDQLLTDGKLGLVELGHSAANKALIENQSVSAKPPL